MVNWCLQDLYRSNYVWEKNLDKFRENYKYFISVNSYKKENLKNIIKFLENAYEIMDSLYTYSLLKYNEDTSNTENIRLLELADKMYSDFEEATLYLQNGIDKDISLILSHPDFKDYRKYYETNYIPEKENYRLNKLYENIGIDMEFDKLLFRSDHLAEFYYKNKKISVTNSNLIEYLQNNDREFRKKVFENVEKNLALNREHSAFILNTHFQIRNELAKLNNYCNAFEYDISNNLLGLSPNSFEIFSDNVKKAYNELLELKRKILKIEKISYYDLYVYSNIGQNYISFEQARNIIINSLQPLGDRYIQLVKKVFEESWIDNSVNIHKKIGGRSFNVYGLHPYISITWTGNLDSLYILTHEIGGAIAQYLNSKNKRFIYSELSIFKTEIFSFLNERLLSVYLRNNDIDNLDKNNISGKIIDNLKDSFFIPIEMSLVELNLSKSSNNSKLSSEVISEIYYDTLENFHAYENFLPLPINQYNWIRVNKLMKNGYNFKYIEAFCVSICIEKLIFNGENVEFIFNELNSKEEHSDFEFIKQIDIDIDLEEILKIISKELFSFNKEGCYE